MGEGLTEPRIEHVQRHLIAFLGASDGDQSFVAVVLRLIDFDHTAAQVANLIDLGPSLANDCTHHVVGNINLLRDGLSRHRLRRLARLPVRAGLRSGLASIRSWLWHWTTITRRPRGGCICLCVRRVDLLSRTRGRGTHKWLRRHSLRRCCVVSLVGIWMAKLPSCGLWHIRNDLHAPRDNPGRPSTPGGISRSARSSKSLSQLLNQGHSYVVGGDMDCICNAEYHQGALC